MTGTDITPLVAGGATGDQAAFPGAGSGWRQGWLVKTSTEKEGQTKIHPNPALSHGTAGQTYSGGKHFRDTPADPSYLERNPGTGSSPRIAAQDFSSGESGINELDEG